MSKEYANINLKYACYDAVVEFYRKVDPKVDRNFVAKKTVERFFTGKPQEIWKIKTSGASSDNQYVQSLWCFDLLMFTQEHEHQQTVLIIWWPVHLLR